jgi:general nucleoside transport system permease protein
MIENEILWIGLSGVLAIAAPLIFASLGETLTERSGVINLSANGTILFSAMASFAVAIKFNSLFLGLLSGLVVGGAIAAIVAFASITLKQSQVAVGFVLALMFRDLAYFLGNPIMGFSGPRISAYSIPVLSELPIIGQLFFRQDILTYLSFALIIITYIWIYKTKPGLMLQGVGERPAAAYVRGANVNQMRYIYTILGGSLIGLAGSTYSLSIKAGWKGTISGLDGIGWIALALTIFGGWNPIRAAFGAYLFSLLQWLGLVLQPYLPGIPSQVLQVAPFPLMILTLLLVNIGNTEWVDRTLTGLPHDVRVLINKIFRALRATPPASLGMPFEQD